MHEPTRTYATCILAERARKALEGAAIRRVNDGPEPWFDAQAALVMNGEITVVQGSGSTMRSALENLGDTLDGLFEIELVRPSLNLDQVRAIAKAAKEFASEPIQVRLDNLVQEMVRVGLVVGVRA